MSGAEGLCGYYLIEGNDEVASITVCDSKAGTDDSNKRAAEWIKDHVPASARLSKPQVTEGETIVEITARVPVA